MLKFELCGILMNENAMCGWPFLGVGVAAR